MKKSLQLLVLMIPFLSINAFGQVSTTGLVGDYSFNGNANDNSSFGNNATTVNAVLTSGQAGAPNTAYHFNGVSNFIEVPAAVSLNADTAITLYAVIKPEGFFNGPCQNNAIVGNWSAVNGGSGYVLEFSDNFYDLNCNAIDTTHSIAHGATAGNNWNQNVYNYGIFMRSEQWYCLAFTQSNNTQKFYVDGVLKVTTTVPNAHIGTSAKPIWFGKETTGAMGFKGIIDEVKIYKRSLSESEIAALCSATATGISEPSVKSDIAIYPNPSYGIFYVKSDGHSDYEIKICDLLGQVVKAEKISMQKEIQIDLYSYAAGTYFVKVNSADGKSFTEKIVKY